MSVRHSLLVLLDAGPMHGYGLKTEFEAATGDVWPLNVGQVYTTLARLERDGLVSTETDADGQKIYAITDAGRGEVRRWFETPVAREVVPRQELAIKLVFAMRSAATDVADVVQRQRVATMRSLQEVTRLKADAEADGDLAWLLMLDALVFQAEAEARWLDLCEARLARKSGERGDRGTPLSRGGDAAPPLPITERSS
jgi:DNA-binding PadR family transcriptional regulator